MALCSALIAAAPRHGAPVTLIYPPWIADRVAFEKIVASQGRPLRFGPLPGMVVALGDTPDFTARAGAIFAFDAGLVAALCSVPTPMVPR